MSVKPFTKIFCNAWMIAILVEPQQLYLAHLTIAAQLVGNGIYEGADLKSTPLVSKKAYDRGITSTATPVMLRLLLD